MFTSWMLCVLQQRGSSGPPTMAELGRPTHGCISEQALAELIVFGPLLGHRTGMAPRCGESPRWKAVGEASAFSHAGALLG